VTTQEARIDALAWKLYRNVFGIIHRGGHHGTFAASSVPSIMACAERQADITAKQWQQIKDLTRRIEALERRRKMEEKRKEFPEGEQ
jgi:Spy/CpxP family protein refolding chaperone